MLDIYKELRPWGSFDRLVHNKSCTVKIITVAPNARLSLQFHRFRDEWWRILEGEGVVEIGRERSNADRGCEFRIPRGINHRISAGSCGMTVLEISFGDFDENDITRVEDDHGRVK